MSAPMVRAILEGRKTQTRRVAEITSRCPHGVPGDRLWVRETWQRGEDFKVTEGTNHPAKGRFYYRADEDADPFGFTGTPWRPSIFMPRSASRITLDLTGVRVERVQEISEEDAKAEGITAPMYPLGNGKATYRLAYSHLWDSLNAKRGFGWEKNPWTWVLEFKPI